MIVWIKKTFPKVTSKIAASLTDNFYLLSLQEALDLQIYANFTANQVEGLLPKTGGDLDYADENFYYRTTGECI